MYGMCIKLTTSVPYKEHLPFKILEPKRLVQMHSNYGRILLTDVALVVKKKSLNMFICVVQISSQSDQTWNDQIQILCSFFFILIKIIQGLPIRTAELSQLIAAILLNLHLSN